MNFNVGDRVAVFEYNWENPTGCAKVVSATEKFASIGNGNIFMQATGLPAYGTSDVYHTYTSIKPMNAEYKSHIDLQDAISDLSGKEWGYEPEEMVMLVYNTIREWRLKIDPEYYDDENDEDVSSYKDTKFEEYLKKIKELTGV